MALAQNRKVSLIGLVVAVVAILLAIALAPAQGTRMVHRSVGGTVALGATCTHYPGAQVSITAPGPGTVVVSATVGIGITHAQGTDDVALVVVANSQTACEMDNFTAFVSVPAGLPSAAYPATHYFTTVPILHPFAVGAGTHTYFVNGMMTVGGGPGDRFDSASLVVVFYPA